MKKVLVVDDSIVALKCVRDALGDEFELKEAKSLKEARSKIGNNSFDLFLFDVNLPDGNGFDFYSELVERGHDQCPIIFFSNSRDKEKILKGMELGQCDYIFKPFANEELRARIDTQISLHQRRKIKFEKEKELLAADFLHHVNNPLACIALAFRALKKEYNIQNSPHADAIEENIKRLTVTRDQILDDGSKNK